MSVITVHAAAWLGASVARGAGILRPLSVHDAARYGAAIHKRFFAQGREVRVV